jgi:protein BCP1
VGKARAKRERDEERSEDSDNMQIDNSDDENANQVDVDFGFMNICDDDYHGVTLILKNLLSGEYNGASLADAILEQQNIGTTVKTDDNEGAICAIASILNPHQYDKYEGVQQLKNYILKNARASGSQKAKEMTEAIFGSQILVPGIVIKERLINVPMQISPGLHQVLLDDINWTFSPEAECPQEEIDYYRFSHLVFLSYFCVDPHNQSGGGKLGSQGKVAERKKKKHVNESDRIYMHGEDETFLESAEVSWAWRVADHDDSNTKYHKYRLAYIMTMDDYRSAVERLSKAV